MGLEFFFSKTTEKGQEFFKIGSGIYFFESCGNPVIKSTQKNVRCADLEIFNWNQAIMEEKRVVLYQNLHIEVKLIDTKRETFGTFEKNCFIKTYVLSSNVIRF